MQEEQPLKPANILNIVATNQGKLPLTMETPRAKPLSPEVVSELMEAGHVIVDARSSAAFGAGHIPGAYNVQQSSLEFEQRVGWVTPDDVPIILVTDSDDDAQRAVFNMAFIALDTRVVGYLDGGISAWIRAGKPLRTVAQMDVHTLQSTLSTNGLQVLDVRDKEEWEEGHIDGAHFMPYTAMETQLDIPSQLDRLDVAPDQSLAVTCATGQRSSIAISMLLRHGYKKLYNVTGGMEAWASAGNKMVDEFGTPI